MTKLRLSAIPDDRPVKITIDLPAPVFRDLQAYAAILAHTAGEAAPADPAKLVAPMLQTILQKGSLLRGQAISTRRTTCRARWPRLTEARVTSRTSRSWAACVTLTQRFRSNFMASSLCSRRNICLHIHALGVKEEHLFSMSMKISMP